VKEQRSNLSSEKSSECDWNADGPDEQHDDAKDPIAHVTLVVAAQREVSNQHIGTVVKSLARENAEHHSRRHREEDIKNKER